MEKILGETNKLIALKEMYLVALTAALTEVQSGKLAPECALILQQEMFTLKQDIERLKRFKMLWGKYA